MTTTSRGGKRPGAGRPVAGAAPTEPRTVTLEPRHWQQLPGDNLSFALRDTLDRLTLSVASERAYLQSLFTASEMAAILDACNGWLADTASIAHLAIEVEDAMADGLAAKWGISGPELVSKLEMQGYFALWTLADAIASWWNRVGAGEDLQPVQMLEG